MVLINKHAIKMLNLNLTIKRGLLFDSAILRRGCRGVDHNSVSKATSISDGNLQSTSPSMARPTTHHVVDCLIRSVCSFPHDYNSCIISLIYVWITTGHVMSRQNIEDVIKFAKKERLFILADEVRQVECPRI